MLDSYKRRLRMSGSNMSEALKQQNNMIMDATFTNSIAYKSVKINNENVDARYYSYKTATITGDAVDYLIQFRPHVKYPLGTYVSIPNNENVYEDWIIVGQSDDVLFPKFNILKCNYTLKWIVNKQIFEYKVALRSRGNSLGLAGNDFMSIIDGQMSVWLPTNQDVNTIHYFTRFLISNNELHPQCYKVTDISDVLSQGITKLTLTKDEVSVYDNTKLMIADYYKQFSANDVINGSNSYQLIGLDSMTINSTSIYKTQTVRDGQISPTQNVSYTVTDLNGNSTNLATYTMLDDEIYITTNNTKGTIVLKATINDVTIDKIIKIKGLL